jgi:hypothetical protein
VNKAVSIIVPAILAMSQLVFSQENGDMKIFKENKTPDSILLRVELSKDKYPVLEPIKLLVTITNESKSNIMLNLTDEISPARIRVADLETKKEIPSTLYGQRLEDIYSEGNIFRNTLSAIEPSRCYTYIIPISRLFDLSIASRYSLECEITYYNSEKKALLLKVEPLNFKIIENQISE